MKKLLFLFLILLQFVWAEDGYFHNRVLFCLTRDHPDLTIKYQNGTYQTDVPELNTLLQKYQAVKIEKWLTSADDRDVVGDVNLSKVYRVEFSSPYSDAKLQEIKNEFANVPGVISADFESINYIMDEAQNDPYTPNDPRYSEQWYVKKIQANDAWGLWDGTPGSTDVLVGVVDTGIDYEHPELENVLYLIPVKILTMTANSPAPT